MNLEGYEISKFSPMMRQYLEIKKDYTDVIVFFRLGDFYEMFFDDAKIASRELELQLTGKDCGQDDRVPMCGIPFHAYEVYALKLVEKGYKIAIVEQTEDPKLAKGIVKREVVKILTPGTCVIGDISNKENNFLACLNDLGKSIILAYTDVATGDSYLTNLKDLSEVTNELLNLHIKEVVVTSKTSKKITETLKNNYGILVSYQDDKEIPTYLGGIVSSLENKEELEAVGILVNYILKTQREQIKHLKNIIRYQKDEYMKIDMHSKRNLELTETIRLGQKTGSLLNHLDRCHTAMGSRMMHKWMLYPLLDKKAINNRLDLVEAFMNDSITRVGIENALKTVYDLERISGKISCGTCNAKDLAQLRRSLSNVPSIKNILEETGNPLLTCLSDKIDSLDELYHLLDISLVDNPPFVLREGGMIKPTYNDTLNELYNLKNNSQDWIINFEASEREKSGIKSLRVSFNKVFGYYIEVTKSFLDNPYLENYERKQTLVGAERFITPELKEFEVKVLSASDKIVQLEYDLFVELKNITSTFIPRIQKLADNLSVIDCLISFANIAINYNYTRPRFNESRELTIIDGRHPVVETVLKSDYVCNDVIVNKYNMILITGPNMSGKSTYMRMVALICIMAQMGSFVPAKSANMMLFDQVFTRIGASDDLMGGASTFMVEMIEANYALQNATKNSLILFDEIGRGTATFDGLALAQAIVEYVHEKIGCLTLFSTHYHELVQLENSLSRLKNIHVDAREEKGKVLFLHKVLDGPIDKSYGINVAALAKLPKSLIERSKVILESLETENHSHNVDLNLFNFDAYDKEDETINIANSELIETLEEIDVNSITPLEALSLIVKLKSLV